MRMGEHERARDVPAERAAETSPPPAVPDLLALQRSAGNRAVGALLARAPDTKEKPRDSPGTGATITASDIGVIPLESFTFSPNQPRVGGTPQELVLVSRHGEHSAALHRAALAGTSFDATIVHRGLTITLKKAIISSYSVGADTGGEGPVETWTISAEALKHEFAPEAGATEP